LLRVRQQLVSRITFGIIVRDAGEGSPRSLTGFLTARGNHDITTGGKTMPPINLGNRSIVSILFARRQAVDVFPSIKGGDPISTPARRNPTPGSASAALVKAVVAALAGHVTSVRAEAGASRVVVVSTSMQAGSSQVYHLGLDRDRNVWYSPQGVTYHIGLIALAEALACPDEAGDLLDAWADLLAYTGGALLPSPQALPDGQLRELVLRASDELYYWLRYRGAAPAPSGLVYRMVGAAVDDNRDLGS